VAFVDARAKSLIVLVIGDVPAQRGSDPGGDRSRAGSRVRHTPRPAPVQLGVVLAKAPKRIVYASRGDVEDSEAQGGQGLQSSTHCERFLWRIDQFERLGFNEAEASDLADSDADLGQARHLLATGCSSTLALQILL
jgi:hypothetical protein